MRYKNFAFLAFALIRFFHTLNEKFESSKYCKSKPNYLNPTLSTLNPTLTTLNYRTHKSNYTFKLRFVKKKCDITSMTIIIVIMV